MNTNVFKVLAILLAAAILLFISGRVANASIELIVEKPGSCTRRSTECITRSCKKLLDAIRGAERTIEFATYGMRGVDHILDALLKAKGRGVEVRGIVDEKVNGGYYYSDTERWKDELQDIRTDRKSERRLHKPKRKYRKSRCPIPVIDNTATGEIIRFEGPRQCVAYETGPDRWRIGTYASRKSFSSMRIMHHKFFVFDRREVWTGSANLSETGIGGCNANVVLYIRSEEAAERYREEFETMWKGRFHEEKSVHDTNSSNRPLTPQKPIEINGQAVRIEFSPQDRAVSEIKLALDRAKNTVNLGIFFLTHKSLTCALVTARNRGVSIRVILDATGAGNEFTKHRILRNAGIPVKVENWAGKMHMKAASIDGLTLIAGSMNWTSAGERVNDENTLVVESKRLVWEFDGHFEALWKSIPDRWKEARPDPESRESIGSCQDNRDNDFDEQIDVGTRVAVKIPHRSLRCHLSATQRGPR